MTEEFVSGERVNEKTRDYVLSIHKRELISVNQGYAKNTDTYHRYGNWQIIYPMLISGASNAKNWDLIVTAHDDSLEVDFTWFDAISNKGKKPLTKDEAKLLEAEGKIDINATINLYREVIKNDVNI